VIGARPRFLASVAAVFFAQIANAQPDSRGSFDVALHYSALGECPDASVIEAIVTNRLGFNPFDERSARHVLVRIGAGDRGLEGHVEWRDNEGRWPGDRTFPSNSDDCADLVRAIGFALAVQIQLLAIMDAPGGPGAAAPQSSQRGNAQRPQEFPTPALAPKSRAVPNGAKASELSRGGSAATPFVGSGVSLGLGLASRPVPLIRVTVGVAWRYAQLELGGELGMPVTTRRADGGGFSQEILMASVAGCGAYDYLSACLLTKAGTVHVAGRDVTAPVSTRGSVLEVGVRLGASVNLAKQLYLAGHAEGLLTLSRWTVTLDDVPVWSAPRFAEIVGVDFGVRFP
jgi:hypothetical protein